MAFDDLKPQSPRTANNTRHPTEANAYGERALELSRTAASRCRTILDIPSSGDGEQKLDVYLPDDESAKGLPVLLFFHGGAWMHGYKEWNGLMAPALVDLPAIFISASYSLAPEHKFPAPQDDAFAALQWTYENAAAHGGNPDRIHVGGWSVGGTLASLLTLRRDLYPDYGLPEGVIKACFAACGGFAYLAGNPAPGNSGRTYGDIMYARPEDDRLATPLNFTECNRVPFYITHGGRDFQHVMNSSAAMAEALASEDCVCVYEVFEDKDHYDCHLDLDDTTDPWVQRVRTWMSGLPTSG